MSNRGWSDREAALEKAKREVAVHACPNCGAKAEVDWVEVSVHGRSSFIPGQLSCSARCWEDDPNAYLRAIRKET